MGFLENLRKKKESEEEAKRQEELNSQLNRVNEKKEQELLYERALLLRTEAKKQFDESGIKDLIDELLKIDRKLKFSSREPFQGDDKYECRIEISGFPIRMYDDGETVSIPIATDHDGAITVTGNNKKSSSIAPKNLWKNNKGILEEALGKAYKNPRRVGYKGSPGPSQG